MNLRLPAVLALLVASALFSTGAIAGTELTVPALQKMLETEGSVVLVDVRTAEEYAAGHIPGAINIPHDQMAARAGSLPAGKPVVLYCKSGRRAGLAAEVLEKAGRTGLSHLQGDFQGWAASGLPVATAADEAAPAPKAD